MAQHLELRCVFCYRIFGARCETHLKSRMKKCKPCSVGNALKMERGLSLTFVLVCVV